MLELPQMPGASGGWNMHPGLDGIPYRTRQQEVPLVKSDDPLSKRPQVTNEVDVKIFDLSDEAQCAEYKRILNLCARALGRILGQDIQYQESTGKWQVLLTWTTYFYEDPAETERSNRQFYT